MESYWNNRFINEGKIWGNRPSQTVHDAKRLFALNDVKTILVPGAGYGRNTKILSGSFEVDGIENSSEAVLLAQKWDPESHFIERSILENTSNNKKYDAIYCYDLLHLFTEEYRKQLIKRCIEQLREKGIYYFTCFSNEDESFGLGEKIEANTFQYKKGKIAHFFDEKDLIHHFSETEIIKIGKVEERFEYSNNEFRTYKLRYIYGKKI